MADLDEYLHRDVGIHIGDTIFVHLLWADDLILVTESAKGLQKQLDGLFNFCSDNMMIVNETKTKVMVYGSASRDVVVKFNDKVLNVADQYKYLGNVMKSIKTCKEYVFGETFQYLCNKARNQTVGDNVTRLRFCEGINRFSLELINAPWDSPSKLTSRSLGILTNHSPRNQ